jgi:hypothetical protein
VSSAEPRVPRKKEIMTFHQEYLWQQLQEAELGETQNLAVFCMSHDDSELCDRMTRQTSKLGVRTISNVVMMILHQVRHGRQDNHATNHVRCAETSRSKQSRRHIEATRPNIARPSVLTSKSD